MYLRGCSPSGAFSYGCRLARKVTENLVSQHRADTSEKGRNVTATRLLFSLHTHSYIDHQREGAVNAATKLTQRDQVPCI